MRLHLAATLAVLLLAAPAQAALAPNYQRAAELSAAISAAAALLPANPIDGVDYIGTDHIRIRAGNCTVEVRIVNVKQSGPPMPGPRQFEAKPGQPACN